MSTVVLHARSPSSSSFASSAPDDDFDFARLDDAADAARSHVVPTAIHSGAVVLADPSSSARAARSSAEAAMTVASLQEELRETKRRLEAYRGARMASRLAQTSKKTASALMEENPALAIPARLKEEARDAAAALDRERSRTLELEREVARAREDARVAVEAAEAKAAEAVRAASLAAEKKIDDARLVARAAREAETIVPGGDDPLDDRRRSGVWKPSTFNGKHLGKKWGVEVDLKRRTVASPGRRPMPPELLAIAARLRDLAAEDLAAEDLAAAPGGGGGESRRAMPRAASRAVATFAPNEANAIDYRRALGMELEPHCDDRQMSSGVLVNLSLLGDCVMTYAPDKKNFDKKHNAPNRSRDRGAVDVFLPRRSLQIQSGSTRYDFSHAIRNENLLADRRVSVTFRESAAPATRTKVRGG